MPPRPYVLLSCATSADGYLDDASPRRLILSGPADLDRVDEVRAGCDAIMVGAQTVRKDNPRLLIRDPRRRARRAVRGLPEHPARVTLTGTGDLDPRANFFAPGAPRLVYCATPALSRAQANLGESAVLIDAGDPVSVNVILQDLSERSVARLLVEGGAQLLGEFLAQDLADEFHLAIAPFFLAPQNPNTAPRLSLPAPTPAPRLNLLAPTPRLNHPAPASTVIPVSPSDPSNPMTLAEAGRVEEMVLLRYLLGPGGPDRRFLRWAVELSRLSPRRRPPFPSARSSWPRTARCWPPASPASRRTTITPRKWPYVSWPCVSSARIPGSGTPPSTARSFPAAPVPPAR